MRINLTIGVLGVSLVGIACGSDSTDVDSGGDQTGAAGQVAQAGSSATDMMGPSAGSNSGPPVAGAGGAPASPTGMAGSSSLGGAGAAPTGMAGMESTGLGGAAGAANVAGAPGVAGSPSSADMNPLFSFFTTSQTGLVADCTEQFPTRDCTAGFGGDLGGLAGADAICTRLAQAASPGDTKTWHAFLSSTGQVEGGGPINAIERVGSGPWYNFNGLLMANDIAGLMAQPGQQGNTDWGRPTDASVVLQEMFTDENGDPVSPDPGVVDNHDTLTGSDKAGLVADTGENGLDATCEDWTSNTRQASGAVVVGHSWPRSNTSGRHWMNEHTVNGCEPGIFVGSGGAPPDDNFTVGGGGGYGAFYCFAVDIVVPAQ